MEARRILKERKQARTYGDAVEAHMFESVAQTYLDKAELKYSTRISYRDCLNRWWGGLHGRDVAGVTTQQLVAMDDAADWLSKKTRLNALIPLRRVFEHARARGYITIDPAAGLRGKQQKRTTGPDPYTEAERDKLLVWLERTQAPAVFALFHTAFFTGMRTGELLGLTWADFSGKALHVRNAYVRKRMTTPKTGIDRQVLLLPPSLS